MKKRIYLATLCVTAFMLVACGSKKIDTGKIDVSDNQEKEEETIPPYIDDDCITVIDEIVQKDDSGRIVYSKKYSYNEDGSPKGVSEYCLTPVKLENDYIWIYNGSGFPCMLQDVKDSTNISQRVATDSQGLTIELMYGDEVEFDSNSNFIKVTGIYREIYFTYADGKIQNIESTDKLDNIRNLTEYSYLGDGISRYVIKTIDVKNDNLIEETIINYQGKEYTQEKKFYGGTDSGVNKTSKYDELGMCTYYTDSNKVTLTGSYNDDRTLFTLVNEDKEAKINGYQVKLANDGRIIKAYKIDPEGNRLSVDNLCYLTYDKNGHLISAEINDYTGENMQSGWCVSSVYSFIRVPKEGYKKSLYYNYENLVDNGLFCNFSRLAEDK